MRWWFLARCWKDKGLACFWTRPMMASISSVVAHIEHFICFIQEVNMIEFQGLALITLVKRVQKKFPQRCERPDFKAFNCQCLIHHRQSGTLRQFFTVVQSGRVLWIFEPPIHALGQWQVLWTVLSISIFSNVGRPKGCFTSPLFLALWPMTSFPSRANGMVCSGSGLLHKASFFNFC